MTPGVTLEKALTVGEALALLAREVVVKQPMAYSDDVYSRNFHVVLPNGWVVSIGFGFGHHCANYGPSDSTMVLEDTPNAELAIFDANGGWFVPHGDQIWENVAAVDVLRVVDAVATYREGGSCPCPDCVRARL